MTKEVVRDRALVRTTPDEATVLAPAALQEFVDAAVARVEGGRCFVRPSGTEDCVRVYAEGATQARAPRTPHPAPLPCAVSWWPHRVE